MSIAENSPTFTKLVRTLTEKDLDTLRSERGKLPSDSSGATKNIFVREAYNRAINIVIKQEGEIIST